MFCVNCGKPTVDDDKYCIRCGAKVAEEASTESEVKIPIVLPLVYPIVRSMKDRKGERAWREKVSKKESDK